MNTQEALNQKHAVERASESFSNVQIWRWRTGKTVPTVMNAAKLAKVLRLEFGLDANNRFKFWKGK